MPARLHAFPARGMSPSYWHVPSSWFRVIVFQLLSIFCFCVAPVPLTLAHWNSEVTSMFFLLVENWFPAVFCNPFSVVEI